jgi:hypothetical protein
MLALHARCCLSRQASEAAYVLVKARRLRDKAAAATQADTPPSVGQEPPAYLSERMGEGKALPEVGVAKLKRSWRGIEDRMLASEAVVRHVVETLRSELLKEVMGL